MTNIAMLKELSQQIVTRVDFKFRTVVEFFKESEKDECTYNLSFVLSEPFDDIIGYVIKSKLAELFVEFSQFDFSATVSSGDTSYPNAIVLLTIRKKE